MNSTWRRWLRTAARIEASTNSGSPPWVLLRHASRDKDFAKARTNDLQEVMQDLMRRADACAAEVALAVNRAAGSRLWWAPPLDHLWLLATGSFQAFHPATFAPPAAQPCHRAPQVAALGRAAGVLPDARLARFQREGAAKLAFVRRACACFADAVPSVSSRRSGSNAAPTGPSHHSGRKGQADRLGSVGLRLHAQRTEQALPRVALGEAAGLLGARRTMLLLDGPEELRVAGCRLPAGENPEKLLVAVAPWLAEARRTRAARLRHGPNGAAVADQRSCLVAPLRAGRQVLGFLDADVEGRFGRFGEADADLLVTLAALAEQALANLRTRDRLTKKAAERTAEARASLSLAERRAAELAVINAVQQALAGQLNLQGVYDAVGMKLREVFPGGGVVIRRVDPADSLPVLLDRARARARSAAAGARRLRRRGDAHAAHALGQSRHGGGSPAAGLGVSGARRQFARVPGLGADPSGWRSAGHA